MALAQSAGSPLPAGSLSAWLPNSPAELHLLVYLDDYLNYTTRLHATRSDTAAIRLVNQMQAALNARKPALKTEVQAWRATLSAQQRQEAKARLLRSAQWRKMDEIAASRALKKFYRRVDANPALAEVMRQLEQAELLNLLD